MLTERVDYLRGVDLMHQETAASEGLTLFQKPLQLFNTKPLIRNQTPVLTSDLYNPGGIPGDCGTQCEVTDTYYDLPYEKPRNKFTPEISIPSVLGIETTDKTTRGVFEKPLLVGAPTLSDRSGALGIPVDATPLLNDATDGLTTIRNPGASPLGLGYTGGNAYIQGSDPMPTFDAPEDAETDVPARGCAWYDFPCKFEAIKGQTTILIIGIILLAVGVFALTR